MTIQEWDISELLDWSRRRNKIKALVYAITQSDLSSYESLTSEEKEIAARYIVVPINLRVENGIVTDAEDAHNWRIVLEKTKESRIACTEKMRLYVGESMRPGKISLTNTQAFFADVLRLINMFNETNNPSFKRWLTNSGEYEFKGFKNTSYWSQEMEDGLLDIYNGNF
jgi:hypothetical protein